VTLGHAGPVLRTYPGRVLDVPRSALLSAWTTAFLDGRTPLPAALRAVTGTDEPHTVQAPEGLADGVTDVTALLYALRAQGSRGLRLVLPVPGDVLGLPGPAEVNRLALEAGECALTVGGPAWALVPEIEVFGSVYEPGTFVTWHVLPVKERRVTDVGSLREAERELREALRTATEQLAQLDVARWREDAADRVAAVRDGGLPAGLLPPGSDPRAVQVLATARRVRAIAELAAEDDGAAVNAWQAERRAASLRGLEAVTRRAIVAAVNHPFERL